jgi:hypothetical protein
MSTMTSPAPAQIETRESTRLHRVLSMGGAAFTAIVIAQNLIRGASAPQNDAPITDVLEHYRDDTGIAVLLTAMFVLGGACLTGFVAELTRRLWRRGSEVWTTVGLIGAIGVIGTFSLVVAAEAALVGAAGRENPDLGTIDALWLTHNAVFSILGLALAMALLGLGRAGAAAGLTPAFFRWLAPVGATALCIGAAGAPVEADGTAMAAMLPALIGFLVWLALLVSTSVRMVRRAD